MTDAAVPEGHQGLHGFLYGEGGAEAHDAGSSYTFREARLPVASRGLVCAARLLSIDAVLRSMHSGRAAPTSLAVPTVQGEDDGSALLPVGPWLAAREAEKPVRGLADAARAVSQRNC